jgi:hypothetical protein
MDDVIDIFFLLLPLPASNIKTKPTMLRQLFILWFSSRTRRILAADTS